MMNDTKKQAVFNALREQDLRQFFIDLVGELGEEREGDDLEYLVDQVLFHCFGTPSDMQDLVHQAFNAGWEARGKIRA